MWVVGSIAAVVLMVAVGSVAYAVTRRLDATASATDAPVGAFATATPTLTLPTPTRTPSGPHVITGATIGGTRSAFEAAFGAPDQMNGTTPWYRTQSPNSLTVEVCFCTAEPGKDGQPRLALFEAKSAYGLTWTTDDSLVVAKMFFPPDARFVRSFSDPDIGLIRVYQSADLAATFPASDFYDSNGGGALPPGTFSIACGAACSIGTGT